MLPGSEKHRGRGGRAAAVCARERDRPQADLGGVTQRRSPRPTRPACGHGSRANDGRGASEARIAGHTQDTGCAVPSRPDGRAGEPPAAAVDVTCRARACDRSRRPDRQRCVSARFVRAAAPRSPAWRTSRTVSSLRSLPRIVHCRRTGGTYQHTANRKPAANRRRPVLDGPSWTSRRPSRRPRTEPARRPRPVGSNRLARARPLAPPLTALPERGGVPARALRRVPPDDLCSMDCNGSFRGPPAGGAPWICTTGPSVTYFSDRLTDAPDFAD
jgi:hypothetical protein